ncbi:MAG: BrxA/BrxB family bacilliredoxin [Bacteroidetes bacterium]|nr:BrxA/BrxB family bacilliredoxin [Bacteroidota bacterium]
MFNLQSKPPIYDPEAVQPMRDELKFVGFEELLTPEKVEEVLSVKDDSTTLVVINSVCGCAAGSARPAATEAVQNDLIPDRITTVFAGQDRDAVDYFRSNYLAQYPPSSPSIALLKNGKVLHILPRHQIEGRTHEEIAAELKNVFSQFTSKKGPSISAEKYKELVHARACGSKIPLNEN